MAELTFNTPSGQTIARPTGDNTQSGLGVYQRTRYLIDSTITTDSHYDVLALSSILAGELSGMACIFGETDFVTEALLVEVLFNQSGHVFLAMGTRNGVDDENDVLHAAI